MSTFRIGQKPVEIPEQPELGKKFQDTINAPAAEQQVIMDEAAARNLREQYKLQGRDIRAELEKKLLKVQRASESAKSDDPTSGKKDGEQNNGNPQP